jgi:hypothetical protein
LSEVGGNSEAIARVGGFPGDNWRPAPTVRSFAEHLSRIVIRDSAEEIGCGSSVPAFVLKILEKRQSF